MECSSRPSRISPTRTSRRSPVVTAGCAGSTSAIGRPRSAGSACWWRGTRQARRWRCCAWSTATSSRAISACRSRGSMPAGGCRRTTPGRCAAGALPGGGRAAARARLSASDDRFVDAGPYHLLGAARARRVSGRHEDLVDAGAGRAARRPPTSRRRCASSCTTSAIIPGLPPRSLAAPAGVDGAGFDRGPVRLRLQRPAARAAALYQRVDREGDARRVGRRAAGGARRRRGGGVPLDDAHAPSSREAAGVGIVGRGIGATLPGYRGLFTALQRENAPRSVRSAPSYLENETQPRRSRASRSSASSATSACARSPTSTCGWPLATRRAAAPRRSDRSGDRSGWSRSA